MNIEIKVYSTSEQKHKVLFVVCMCKEVVVVLTCLYKDYEIL